jgi:hypothetical protein
MEGEIMNDEYTSEEPFVTTRTDADGTRWWFRYHGGSSVKIRPAGSDDWTNQIMLSYYGMRPDTVTSAWLNERASKWIDQHNADVASGQI